MKHRHPILTLATGLLLVTHLVLVFAAAPCFQGGCEGMVTISGERFLPACCCGPGACSSELASAEFDLIAPSVEAAQAVSSQMLTAPVSMLAPFASLRIIDASPRPGDHPAGPPLYLQHASFLI